ncbi:MAG TPA: type III polyketide synthase [Gammaproteobacteria bacterium]|nr:type III polyketide synthase [Gammaproteobacteria bacterium]
MSKTLAQPAIFDAGTPQILGLATAVPPFREAQDVVARKMAVISDLDERETKWLQRLYSNSRVKYRQSVVSAFAEEIDSWQIFGKKNPISTAARNAIYKQQAPKLSHQAAQLALDTWGGKAADITHIIFVSCTGVMAPGVQSYLQKSLHLSPYINQIGLNMMGCFGAFKGLDLAAAYARQNPDFRILVVCCELCTLHLQASNDPEHQVGNALFADGAAACIVGTHAKPFEQALYSIEKNVSYSLPDTSDKMTWEVIDTGFLMGLKPDVPQFIFEHIAEFAQKLLPKGVGIYDCQWPVHPGGKQILNAVQNALNLTEEHLACSWEVLAQHGNMSSATFLFILDAMNKQSRTSPWAIGLGFGPGLTVEGVLLGNSPPLKKGVAGRKACGGI